MKLTLLLLIALTFFTACGSNPPMPGNATPDPQGTKPPRATPTPTIDPQGTRPQLSA